MITCHILDTCALIAFFKKETGFEKMIQFFEYAGDQKISLFMHKLNLLEVYYGFYRDDGNEQAESVLMDFFSLPVIVIDDLTDPVFRESGRLKALYNISLADSVALALAAVRKGSLITADHHEFDLIEQKEKINFSWVR